jgi:hypothetical protein
VTTVYGSAPHVFDLALGEPRQFRTGVERILEEHVHDQLSRLKPTDRSVSVYDLQVAHDVVLHDAQVDAAIALVDHGGLSKRLAAPQVEGVPRGQVALKRAVTAARACRGLRAIREVDAIDRTARRAIGDRSPVPATPRRSSPCEFGVVERRATGNRQVVVAAHRMSVSRPRIRACAALRISVRPFAPR